MKVSELAKKLNTTNDDILSTLKSLKLKAKDGKQELSSVVVSVVQSAWKKKNPSKAKSATAKKTKKTAATKKTATTKKEVTTKKKAVKKTVKKAVKKEKTVKKKAVAKKDEKVVKKKVKKVSAKAPKTKSKIAEATTKTLVKKKKVAPKKAAATTTKPKTKIGNEPVFTLKPLARKRRKSGSAKDEAKDKALEKEKIGVGPTTQRTDASPADTTPPEPVEIDKILARDESLPDIEIKVPITVKDFSTQIKKKPSIVLMHLMKMGVVAHINQALDAEPVAKLAREFGFNLAKIRTQEEQLIEAHKQEEDDPKTLTARAPVVTFMGHVDHGKTSLLDKIRKSKIADDEHGGITQHIGAYSVSLPKGQITFLDTPGHEAFTAMRARGAHITDIVVVVIAADEGIMPQTEEAIDHARAAGVPIVIALNKIDRTNADTDRVKKQLAEVDLMAEDWGGKTVVCGVSAMTGEGIDNLLEHILLEAELLELKANADKKASGIVVEAHLSQGKGAVTTLIVQSGSLKEGDFIVVGPYYGKVKAMFNDLERPIKMAGPSMPVEILGLSQVPEAGEMFYVVDDEKQSREIALRRSEQLKNKKLHAQQKITLEDLYSQIQDGSVKELSVILKSDVQGSLEALKDSLAKIPNDKVKLKFIHSGVGEVNASDVLLAVASKAIIIAFHVGIGPRAKKELEKDPVDIREYRIIYDAVSDIKNALEGLLDAKLKKNSLSRIEIREVFKLSKHGIIAGCYVTKGKVTRKNKLDLIRNDEVIYSGSIGSLKRFKDDVKEVTEGMECGISIQGFDKIQAGDIIETYEIESIAQKL